MDRQAGRSDLDTLQANLLQALNSNLAALESRLRQTSKADLAALELKLRQELLSKNDFQAAMLKIYGEFSKTNSRTDALQEEMRAGFRQINGRFDAFLSKLETYGRESQAIPDTLDEHGRKLRDHERRLKALESDRHGRQ